MPCCGPSRRDLLRWSVALAATPVLGGGVARAATPATVSGAIATVGLELVTLTEDSAVLTWYTGASDCWCCYAAARLSRPVLTHKDST